MPVLRDVLKGHVMCYSSDESSVVLDAQPRNFQHFKVRLRQGCLGGLPSCCPLACEGPQVPFVHNALCFTVLSGQKS